MAEGGGCRDAAGLVREGRGREAGAETQQRVLVITSHCHLTIKAFVIRGGGSGQGVGWGGGVWVWRGRGRFHSTASQELFTVVLRLGRLDLTCRVSAGGCLSLLAGCECFPPNTLDLNSAHVFGSSA